MGDAFRALEAAKQERLLDNYSLSQTSLEQVFLNIAADASREAEAAAQQLLGGGGGGGSGAAAVAVPPGTVSISVAVPAGASAGDKIQIEHEGASYDVTVPTCVTQGQAFVVALPSRVAPMAPASM